VDECPTSFVTPLSVAWVETYLAWRRGVSGDLLSREARDADAFLLLEKEWQEWRENGEQFNR
jgi:hypothetical protein